MAPLKVGTAYCQGGKALNRALHRRTHRAGIQHVGAQVWTVVDAGEHQIRPLIQQGKQGELDAVGGGAAAGPGLDAIIKQLISPLRPDGGLQGETVARSGALLVGTHHTHLVAAGQGRIGQGANAFSEDPVVVADQDLERCHRA